MIINDGAVPNPRPQQNAKESTKDPIDVIWGDLSRIRNDHREIFLSRDLVNGKITGILYYNDGSIWAASDLYAYSARDGKMYQTRLQQDKTLGMKWRNFNYQHSFFIIIHITYAKKIQNYNHVYNLRFFSLSYSYGYNTRLFGLIAKGINSLNSSFALVTSRFCTFALR